MKDPPSVDFRGALACVNCEFVAEQVGTRHGFGQIAGLPNNLVGVVNSLYQWLGPFNSIASAYGNSAVVYGYYYNTSGSYNIEVRSVANNTLLAAGAFTGAGAGASYVGVGMRIYAAFFNSSQAALVTPGVIALYNNAGSAANYGAMNGNTFLGPISYTPTASEPAAGNVTAGVHRLGYLLEYTSGFTTRVSPDNSTGTPTISTFQPVSVTASGSKNLRLAFANNWDSAVPFFGEIHAVSVVMTTTTNLNQYYIVPGTRTVRNSGDATAFNIDFNITDADLASQGIDASQYLFWLTYGNNNATAPFTSRHLALWGDRMVYLVGAADSVGNPVDTLYVSERNNYQAITIDQHLIQLPGQRPIVTMFRMGGNNYVVGPHEIYTVTDTGDVPVTWPTPSLVDGKHGTLAIHGIDNSPGSNYAWVADQSGLYLFDGGPILGLPISYLQTPDWQRINWNAAAYVTVKDDVTNKRVYVMAPLDGATTPSHILTWDYTNGAMYDQVRYSIWSIAAGANYPLGAMEIVRNDLPSQATNNISRTELWLAPYAANKSFLRQMSDYDTNPYRDNNSTGINSQFQTPLFPGKGVQQGILQHHGFHARLRGNTTLTPIMYDMDGARNFSCRSLVLASSTPDQEYLFLGDMRSELASVLLSSNYLDGWFKLTSIKWYYSPWITQR